MRQAYKITRDVNQALLPFSEGDIFNAWAKKYFTKRRLNKMIPYSVALAHFRQNTIKVNMSSVKFKKGLYQWCFEKGYSLDPKCHQNAGGRIIRKCKVAFDRSVATEMLFIQTNVNYES